jgi:hypothetical protein
MAANTQKREEFAESRLKRKNEKEGGRKIGERMRVKALSVKFSMIFAYFSSRKSRCPSGMRKREREQQPDIFCNNLIVKLYVIINSPMSTSHSTNFYT